MTVSMLLKSWATPARQAADGLHLGRLPQFRFEAARLGDVVGDARQGHDLALAAAHGREAERHGDPRAVLAPVEGVEGRDALACVHALQQVAAVGVALGRDEHRHVLADDLVRGVPVEPFGAGIPRQDGAVQRGRHDGIVRALDERAQAEPLLALAIQFSGQLRAPNRQAQRGGEAGEERHRGATQGVAVAAVGRHHAERAGGIADEHRHRCPESLRGEDGRLPCPITKVADHHRAVGGLEGIRGVPGRAGAEIADAWRGGPPMAGTGRGEPVAHRPLEHQSGVGAGSLHGQARGVGDEVVDGEIAPEVTPEQGDGLDLALPGHSPSSYFLFGLRVWRNFILSHGCLPSHSPPLLLASPCSARRRRRTTGPSPPRAPATRRV